jgi:hypothetical protein
LRPAKEVGSYAVEGPEDYTVDGVFVGNAEQIKVLYKRFLNEGENPIVLEVYLPKQTVVYEDELMPESSLIVKGSIAPRNIRVVDIKNVKKYNFDNYTTLFSELKEFDETAALTYLKELENGIFEDKRNIKGEPIPQKEVTRGTRITRNTLRDELERWRSHPILSLYAPTEEEIKAKLNEIPS